MAGLWDPSFQLAPVIHFLILAIVRPSGAGHCGRAEPHAHTIVAVSVVAHKAVVAAVVVRIAVAQCGVAQRDVDPSADGLRDSLPEQLVERSARPLTELNRRSGLQSSSSC